MLRFFWIIILGFGLINGALAQVDEAMSWADIQKNLKGLSEANGLHYLDSIWQVNGQSYSANDRIRFVLKKGKLIEKSQSREAGFHFLTSDSIYQVVKQGNPEAKRLASYYRARAGLARLCHNYATAIDNYDLALAHYHGLENVVKARVDCFYFAGQCAIRMLNYEKAINYLQQALYKENPGKRKVDAQRYLLMALNFTGQSEQVINLFRGLDDFSEMKPLKQIRMQKEYGIALVRQGDLKLAEQEIKSILSKGKKGEAKVSGLFDYAQFQAAEIYTEANEFDQAAQLYLINIKADKRTILGEKNRELAKKYERLGNSYFNAEKYELALAASQSALIQIFPKFNKEDTAENPPLSAIQRESFMMSIPALKAKCLRARYAQTKELNLLENASACHALSLKAVQLLLAGYQSDGSKLFLQSYINDYLEEALATEYTLAKAARNPEAFSRAFAFMSAQKAIVLREALVKNAALIKADIPFDIQEQFQENQERIHNLRLEISQSEISNTQDSLNKLLNTQIQKHQSFTLLLQQSYPAYERLLNQQASLSLSAIQEKLKPNQAILQFFWGQEKIYSFWIEKNKLQFEALDTEEIAGPLSDFVARINDRQSLENEPEKYFAQSGALAQELFLKPKGTPGQQIKNITIIPDGPLFFLPFGCLTQTAAPSSFAKANYLLNEYIFTYAYSPDLYFGQGLPRQSNGKALGIFPFLKNQKPGFAPLRSGQNEIAQLEPQITLIADQEAGLAQFQNLAAPYSLIHLSTHANTGDAQHPPSIEFIDSTLYLPQLYSSKLSADLVVLSACQTSLGDLQAGEGAMSLARGFFYAGANNLISTLWSVNEKSTSHLLSNFYQQALDNELPLSAALTAAQRNYLQDPDVSPLKKSPYYWAGLHLNGKDGLLHLKRGGYGPGLIIAFLLLIGSWFFFKKISAKG